MTAARALFCYCSPQTSICSRPFTESEKWQAHGKVSNFSKGKSQQKEEEELLECYRREANFCCRQFFILGNFYFPFVSTSLAYITIPQNKRKTKIT